MSENRGGGSYWSSDERSIPGYDPVEGSQGLSSPGGLQPSKAYLLPSVQDAGREGRASLLGPSTGIEIWQHGSQVPAGGVSGEKK